MRGAFAAIALAALALSFAGVRPGAAQPADTIFLNGKIPTLDERSSVAQAMALRSDRVIAKGVE